MVFDRFGGCILRGPEADLPSHASYWSGYKYECTNNGNIYSNNGSAWVLIQGATKSETLKNKQINFDQNTISGIMRDPFSLNKRIGYFIPSPTIAGSVQLALKGLPAVGTYSLAYDSTEKYISRFTEASVAIAGYQSNGTAKFTTRRSLNPYLKVRARSSNAENTYMFLGFTTKLPNTSGAYPVDPTNAGVFVGSTNTNANYIIRTSDGTTHNHIASSIPRDSIFRTYEIIMSSSDIVVKIDGATISTITTNLPGLNLDINLIMELHNRSSTNNFEIVKAYFESDL